MNAILYFALQIQFLTNLHFLAYYPHYIAKTANQIIVKTLTDHCNVQNVTKAIHVRVIYVFKNLNCV